MTEETAQRIAVALEKIAAELARLSTKVPRG
jgi:hypothetical protein